MSNRNREFKVLDAKLRHYLYCNWKEIATHVRSERPDEPVKLEADIRNDGFATILVFTFADGWHARYSNHGGWSAKTFTGDRLVARMGEPSYKNLPQGPIRGLFKRMAQVYRSYNRISFVAAAPSMHDIVVAVSMDEARYANQMA